MGEGGIGAEETARRATGVLAAFVEGLRAGREGGQVPLPGDPPVPDASDDRPDEAVFLRACGARLGLCAGVPPAGRADGPQEDRPEVGGPATGGPAVETVEFACAAGVLMGLATRCDSVATQVESLAHAAPFTGAPLLAAAAGSAAAVSAGLDGASWPQRLALAAWAADEAPARGDYRPGPSMSARLTWACALAERAEADPVQVVGLLVGNSGVPQECVPAAFALAAVCDDADAARRSAARLGGQVDVIGALAGALLAAGFDPAGPTPGPADAPAAAEAGQTDSLRRLAAELTARRGV